jgi:hypothetical protein
MRRSTRLPSGESLHERQGGVSDIAPAVVDREGVAAVGELDELGDARNSLRRSAKRPHDATRVGIRAK